MRNLLFFLYTFCIVFSILALITYSSHDPAWTTNTTSTILLNKGGIIGAYYADILYLITGLSALLVPVLFLHLLSLHIRQQSKEKIIIGWVLLIFCLSSYAQIFFSGKQFLLPAEAGGLLGQYVLWGLTDVLGFTGMLVFLHCCFLGALCLLTSFSPVLWIEKKIQSWSQVQLSASFKKKKESSGPKSRIDLDLIKDKTVEVRPQTDQNMKEWQEQGQKLVDKLKEYSIQSKITAIVPGPVIVRFEMQLAAGERGAKVVTLAKDLARALMLSHIHVVENIPGKSAIGIDIPQKKREMIPLKPLLKSCDKSLALPLVLGVCSQGEQMIIDLSKLPHLLVAGATGSGKSVGMNGMLLTLLTQKTPEELRLVLIDPKVLEFARYSHLPHLALPVISEHEQALACLRWCVDLMEKRYQLLAKVQVRSIKEYQEKRKVRTDWEPMPYLVVVIDELADLMMMSKKAVEEPIARLAQKARACGIHLIIATQRPSVDVITGLIKANIPARLAYAVSSRIDSRTILDQQGAEHLLGMGDAFFLQPGEQQFKRVHGAYVSDEDLERVLSAWSQEQPSFFMSLEKLCLEYLIPFSDSSSV